MVLRSLSILLLSGVALATAEEELLTLPMAGGSQTLVLAAAEVGVRAAANPDAPLVAYPVGAVRSPRTRVLIGRHVLVRLAAGADPATVLGRCGGRLIRPTTFDARLLVVEPDEAGAAAGLGLAQRLRQDPSVVQVEQVVRPARHRTGTPNDPAWTTQDHLQPDHPATCNPTPVWNFTTETGLGAGLFVAVVDDGITSHPDWGTNLRTDLGYSYRESQATAIIEANDVHGTLVGGLIAARGNNGIDLCGVAPRASLVPLQLIGDRSRPGEEEPDAVETCFIHGLSGSSAIAISNNSWGPGAGAQDAAALPITWAEALLRGVTEGRRGRGIVYVFASGNNDFFDPTDLFSGDNASYDGWGVNRFTIAVGAIDHRGGRNAYSFSEASPGLLCVAAGGADWEDNPSNPLGGTTVNAGIVTLDRPGADGIAPGNVTTRATALQGTSFSTPIVSGVVALALEANPLLTYRDVMHLLARHSVVTDATDEHLKDDRLRFLPPYRTSNAARARLRWQTNGASPALRHSVFYGFGRVDAAKAVTAARAWLLAPPLTTLPTVISGGFLLPDRSSNDRTVTVSGAHADLRMEHVELRVRLTHPRRGQVNYRLTSPAGSTSVIEARPNDIGANLDFTFTTVVHWGESPLGRWTLTAEDETLGLSGRVLDWSLTIHGYQDYPEPVVSATLPTSLVTGAGDQTVVLTSDAFWSNAGQERLMTEILVGTTALTATRVNAQKVQVTVPGSLITGSSVTLTVRNPRFASQFTGTPGVVGTTAWRQTTTTLPVIAPSPPVITSGTAINALQGDPIAYQATADFFPTSWSATDLPPGLVLRSDGFLSGNVSGGGVWNASLTASNATGSDRIDLTITITAAAPVITSSSSTSGTVGVPFSYQITASRSPTNYTASPLPAGLSLNATTGAITGTPTLVGNVVATLGATNDTGTGTATLGMSILAKDPDDGSLQSLQSQKDSRCAVGGGLGLTLGLTLLWVGRRSRSAPCPSPTPRKSPPV